MAHPAHSPSSLDRGARIANLVVGVWLFISAFVWPHTAAARTNTWILGVLIAAIAAAGLFVPVLRWANTACAVWLFVSTLVIHHASPATLWNNLIVAIVVFLFSLSGSVSGAARPAMAPTTPRTA